MTRKIIATIPDGDAPIQTGDAPVVTADFVTGGNPPNTLIASISCREMSGATGDILTVNLQDSVRVLVLMLPDGTSYKFDRDELDHLVADYPPF
jgi:hypothetical protein